MAQNTNNPKFNLIRPTLKKLQEDITFHAFVAELEHHIIAKESAYNEK
jgi:hypothetical protein